MNTYSITGVLTVQHQLPGTLIPDMKKNYFNLLSGTNRTGSSRCSVIFPFLFVRTMSC